MAERLGISRASVYCLLRSCVTSTKPAAP
ncbi:hypothetical protein [Sphingomonas jatrophae]